MTRVLDVYQEPHQSTFQVVVYLGLRPLTMYGESTCMG